MKVKNGIKIEDEERYPERPKTIDLLRSTIDSMKNESKKHEKEFRDFDKSSIPKEFLFLCWNYKEDIEKLIAQYETIDGSSYTSTKVGKPEKVKAKNIALNFVQNYQKSLGDNTKFPSYMELFEAVNKAFGRLVQEQGDEPEVSERTCSDWLTQMRRGKFKCDTDDPWF